MPEEVATVAEFIADNSPVTSPARRPSRPEWLPTADRFDEDNHKPRSTGSTFAPAPKAPDELTAPAVPAISADDLKVHSSATLRASPLGSPLLVPGTLLFAAYVVYLFPERGIAVLLLLGALATFGPTSEPLVCFLIDHFEKVAAKAASSQQLHTVARDHMRGMLADPHIKRSFTDACRESLLEAMTDQRSQTVMVSCCTRAMATATIAASQDRDLQNTLNTAMRSGVKEALTDSTLIDTLFNVMKEGLRDPKLHAAALKGAVTAANPLKDLKVPHLPEMPDLTPATGLKAMSSTLKEVMVGVEAKSLSSASGLSRAPPPTIRSRTESTSSGDHGGDSTPQ